VNTRRDDNPEGLLAWLLPYGAVCVLCLACYACQVIA
jgi:hypothetical protein